MKIASKSNARHPKKRLSLVLSAAEYEEACEMAQARNRSVTDTVRIALGLLKIAIDTHERGNKLLVQTPEGSPDIQLVMPGL
jgi:hypothetical protein